MRGKNLNVSISCSFNPKIKIGSTEKELLKLPTLTKSTSLEILNLIVKAYF